MPQESFAVSFEYPDVLLRTVGRAAQNVHELVIRIGDPTPTDETVVSLARDGNTHAARASSAAHGMWDDFKAAIGPQGMIGRAAHNAHATWEKLEQVPFGDFATKEDLGRLAWLTLALWWLDHMCWYFFNERVETAVGVVCHHAGLGDAARRDTVTGEELSRVADQHHVPHPPPDEMEKVLRTAKAFATGLPSPHRKTGKP